MPMLHNKQTREQLSMMMHHFDVLKTEAGGGGYLTINSMQTAVYLFLGMTEQGLELHKVANTLGFRQQSSADRVFYALADDPQMVRGGRCLGWFTIRKDAQDARYRRIFMTDRGKQVLHNLMGPTLTDLERWEAAAWKDAEESKVHHHLEAESAHFWADDANSWEKYLDDPKWGSSEIHSIPNTAWRNMPQKHKEYFINTKKKYWWVDTKTGATWQGLPNANPFRASRTMTSLDFLEAMRLDEQAGWTRKRGDRGRWYLFNPNKDPAVDEPDSYIKDADKQLLANYVASKRDAIISKSQSLDDALKFADLYLNKGDFNRFRRALHKVLTDHELDLERKMGAEYRNQVAAEGMSKAAAKHAALTEMELDAKGKHMHPQERARLEAERAQSLEASQELEERSKPSQEYLDMKKQVEDMAQMMKQMQQQLTKMNLQDMVDDAEERLAAGEDDDA
jgi:hypothetical protein